MALSELKQTEAELKEYGVQSAPDKLTGSAAENKMIFDRLFQNVGISKFNLLLDYLLDGTAASEMGINYIPELADAETVQAALEALVQAMKDISAGAVAEGSITTSKMADAAITGPKLAARSVTAAKIELAAIITELLADRSVTEQKIALLAITTALLADEAVTEAKLSDGAVTSAKLGAGSAITEKIADKAVTTAKLADTGVTTGKIANGAVTKAKLGSDVTAAALGGAVPSVTKTATLSASGWASKKQTVTVSGITTSQHLVIAPAPASYVAYGESMVRCVTQAANSLTFQCEDVPTASLTVNILIVG